jgi:hypothetical protein
MDNHAELFLQSIFTTLHCLIFIVEAFCIPCGPGHQDYDFHVEGAHVAVA